MAYLSFPESVPTGQVICKLTSPGQMCCMTLILQISEGSGPLKSSNPLHVHVTML